MTATQILTNKLALKCCGVFSRGFLCFVCFAVAVVINKLSHLSDRVHVQFLLAAESTKFISVISFGKELYKRREGSESRSFRFKRQLPSSVSLSQRRLANRKVFRILDFNPLYMQLPLNLHREKRCFLQCKNRVNINQKIIFLRNI